MPVLTGIDVLGVQRYVFASNRLRDAVAASWLVHWATSVEGTLSTCAGQVLLAGGGNAIVRFSDEAQARDFLTSYTRQLYNEAPGLEVIAVMRKYEDGSVAAALRHLQVDLARAKLERVPSVPQLGISVTEPCRITGLPATGVDPQDPSVPLSRMVLRWRNRSVRERAMARWGDELLTKDQRFAFPPEIDDMGRTPGNTSLLGVVHVDGNGIGEQITGWLQRCVENRVPDSIVESELQEWSTALDSVGLQSLQAVATRVTDAIDDKGFIVGRLPQLGFKLCRREGPVFLPLQPVLLGGDDLTFLCDGRLALHLAEVALDSFSAEIPHLGHISACAGVALVPAHTPFDRAYELADALCSSAKKQRRETGAGGSWLDWHIGTPRPGEGIDDLRRRTLRHRIASIQLELTCRPYRLGESSLEPETWRWLSDTVMGSDPDGFRGERWQQHRNKLRELAAAVRGGTDHIGRLRDTWTVAVDLPWPGELEQTNGFLDGVRTPLLDAVELLDVHLPLHKGSS